MPSATRSPATPRRPTPTSRSSSSTTAGKRNEALLKAFKTAGAAVDECPKIKSAGDRLAFIRNEVRLAGGRIAADAATALLEAVGNDLRDLSVGGRPAGVRLRRDRRRGRRRPLLPGAGRGQRVRRGRQGDGRRHDAAPWRRCAGRWAAAWPTCSSPTRSPTASGPRRGSSRSTPAPATWRGPSGCRSGRSTGPAPRPAAGASTASSRPSAWRPSSTPTSRAPPPAPTTRSSGRCAGIIGIRAATAGRR